MQLQLSFVDATAFLIALTASSAAFAGMLMVEEYGLKEIAASKDAVALVTVEKKIPPKDPKGNHELQVKVERVFGASSRFKVGGSVTVSLAKLAVEWTDPGESPIDESLRGSLGNAPVGARVLVVPSRKGDVELLAADERNVLRASVRFDDAERTKWLASPDATLIAALGDIDLAALAAAELTRRKKLTAADVLRGEWRFAYAHYHALQQAERRAFLESGLASAKTDNEARDRLFRLATSEPCPSTVAPLATLITLYDPAHKDSERKRDDVRSALISATKCKDFAKLDTSPFASFLIEDERLRATSDRGSGRSDVVTIVEHMNKAAQSRVAVGLLDAVAGAKKRNGSLLRVAADIAVKAPSRELLVPLAKLVPMKHAKAIADPDAMLSIGSALVEAMPPTRKDVQAIMQPYLDMKAPAKDEVLARYKKIVGDLGVTAPVRATFDLDVGQARRLSDGAQLSFQHGEEADRETDPENVLWFAHFNHGSTLSREVDADGYHEWWGEPYVIVADGTRDHVTVTVTPFDKRPEPLSHAAISGIAREVAEKAGCDSPDADGDYKPWLGRMIYTTGKCKIVIGAFTKNVVIRTK